MANTAKLKQSAVAGKVPTTSQLALGELAVNTTDGKLFLKKSVSGVESVVDLTAAAAGVSSYNGRTGAVTETSADITGALGFTPARGTGNAGTASLNSIIASGVYRVDNTSANSPLGSNVFGQLLVMRGNNDTITQIYGDYSTGTLYTRSGNPPDVGGSGTWTAWRKLLDNNNLPGSGVSEFVSGTAMLFAQTTAPTGWTKSTVHNDKALRVVSGTAGSGGTVAFSTAFSTARASDSVTATGNVGYTTLDSNTLPSHNHGLAVYYTNPTEMYGGSPDAPPIWGKAGVNFWNPGTYTTSAGASWGHNHSLTINAHSHSTNINVQYVDVIIATKD